MVLRKMFGSYGDAPRKLGRVFVSGAAMENAALSRGPHGDRLLRLTGTRTLRKREMIRNATCPDVRVDRDSFEVFVDGEKVSLPPATNLPLNRRYLLI